MNHSSDQRVRDFAFSHPWVAKLREAGSAFRSFCDERAVGVSLVRVDGDPQRLQVGAPDWMARLEATVSVATALDVLADLPPEAGGRLGGSEVPSPSPSNALAGVPCENGGGPEAPGDDDGEGP